MKNRHIAELSAGLFAFACLVVVGCSPGSLTPHGGVVSREQPAPRHHRKAQPGVGPSPYIQHVVIVIQENRSLNTIFGGSKPFPGADAQSYGYESNGSKVTLSKVEFEDTSCDIDHFYSDAVSALNTNGSGTYQMNGFNLEQQCGQNAGKFPYKYVDYAETKPYWFMASHWVLGDQFFPTELGPSFTAHLNLIAGTDEVRQGRAVVNFPTDWDQNPTDCASNASQHATVDLLYKDGSVHNDGTFPCFWQFHTMADLLDLGNAAGTPLSWRYYAPTVSNEGGRIWSEFDAIERVRCGTNKPISSGCTKAGPDWANVVTPSHQILKDISNGFLANVSWVVPTLANSDHQGCAVGSGSKCTGPEWVASIVNAVGNSKFWNSTAIVVLWDDWGGWYDEIPPPQYDFRGKAIRTAVIVISPYTILGSNYYYYGHGSVSHNQYEPGSILKFIEKTFNLPSLSSLACNPYYYYYYPNCNVGYTDSTAQYSIGDGTLDFTQTPRPFTPVPTPQGYGQNYFMSQPESANAPDNE